MIGEQREALVEQWVLEFVIKNSFPIDWFGVDTEAEFICLTNRYLGTLGVVDVREALVRLAAAGAITFKREGSSPNYLRRPLDNLELRAAMRGSSPYQYSLTVLGGQLWEDRAHPRWEHFVATGYGHAAPEFGRNSAQISAQTRELAEQYLERQHVLMAM